MKKITATTLLNIPPNIKNIEFYKTTSDEEFYKKLNIPFIKSEESLELTLQMLCKKKSPDDPTSRFGTLAPPIGRGIFGTAYLHSNNPKWVVKVNRVNSPKNRREVVCQMIASYIKNNASPKVHYVIHTSNAYIIIMDLVDGTKYETWLKRNTVFKSRIQVLTSTVQSILALHKEKITHNDLNEKNIMINELTLKSTLIDFGSSCIEESSQYDRIQFAELIFYTFAEHDYLRESYKSSRKKRSKKDLFHEIKKEFKPSKNLEPSQIDTICRIIIKLIHSQDNDESILKWTLFKLSSLIH